MSVKINILIKKYIILISLKINFILYNINSN